MSPTPSSSTYIPSLKPLTCFNTLVLFKSLPRTHKVFPRTHFLPSYSQPKKLPIHAIGTLILCFININALWFWMSLKLCVFVPQTMSSWDELAPAPMPFPLVPSPPCPALLWDAELPCPRRCTGHELHQQPDHLLARRSPGPLFADNELGPTCLELAEQKPPTPPQAHHPAPWLEETPTIWSAGAA